MQTLVQDLRYGARMIWRSRGLSAVIILILAVGIGSSAILASMVETLLIWYSYETSDRFDVVRGRLPKQNANLFLVSVPELREIRGLTDVFEDVGAIRYANVALTDGEYPERFGCGNITWNAIPMTGNKPLLGRVIRPDEDGPGGSRVAVIGYRLWQQHFHRDPQILTRTMKIDGAVYSIIGVMPPHWALWGAQIWTPMGLDWAGTDRSARNLWTLAVLRRGVTPAQANARLAELARRMEREHLSTNPEYAGMTLQVWNIKEAVQAGLRPAVLVLVAAVALLLLIACANVASMLLARSTVRSREISIRMALGAGRARILRQLLTESFVLVGAGGLAGVLLAHACLPLVVSLVPAAWLPAETEPSMIQLDAGALAVAVAVSLLTGVLFGLAPAWLAARPRFGEALKAGGQRVSGDRQGQKARHGLIIGEIALTLVVLAGSILMIESYRRLEGLNLGFRPDHLLSFNIALPPARYSTPEKIAAFYQQALERIAALPGVRGAATGTGRPVEDRTVDMTTQDFTIEGRPAQNGGVAPNANFRIVSPQYFDVMGIGLKRGRGFTDADRSGAPRVALINETMARVFWPGADPVGQHIRLGNQYQVRGPRQENAGDEAVTIVGVVADVHQIVMLESPVRQEMYFPQQQRAGETLGLGVTLYVRSVQDPEALTEAARRAVAQVDAEQPIFHVVSMDETVANALGPKRLAMQLLAFFALVATTLSAIGLYAVMAYSVNQRRQEIGVRLAIGAQPRDIRRLVLGQGTRLAAAGVGAGIVMTLASTRAMGSLLYGVSPTDPLTIGGVAALLLAVALAASWLPARRATRVDPLVALRYE
jgi:putative ABC transport system permease protein